jgi:hypothetical protein
MKTRNAVFFPFLALLVFVISVGCLCTGLTTDTPTEEAPVVQPPVQQPTQAPVVQPTEVPATEAPVTNNSSGGLTTFTDQNELFAIDVPSDWEYSYQNVTDEYAFYADRYTSPDGTVFMENIVYDDTTPFVGGQNGRLALDLLNKYYSYTGREGDIRIAETKEQKDGSTRMTWTSKEGKYSGVSFFEVRNKTTFLMLTLRWENAVEEQYLDTINAVIDSYRVP